MIKPIGSDELQPRFVYDTELHAKLAKEAETLDRRASCRERV